MQIKFPDPQKIRRSIPPECVPQEHRFIMDMHLSCVKQQSEQNLFHIKWLGLFIIAVAAFFFLGGQNFSTGFLKATIFLGVGALFIMIWHGIFLTAECDRKVAACIQDGKALEEQYPEIIMSQIFHTLDKTRVSGSWFVLFDRFIPFAVVTLITAAAAITLNLKNLPLVISICIFSVAILVACFFFFRWLVKKNY